VCVLRSVVEIVENSEQNVGEWWIRYDRYWRCSSCLKTTEMKGRLIKGTWEPILPLYCPICGIRMRNGDETNESDN